MNILITGLPGVGKGTHSEKIVKEYGVLHLSTGEMMRAEKKSGSELGELLSSYMDNGKLVPDEVTIKILKKALLSDETKKSNGFLLDGFPRTIIQAQALDEMLEENELKIDLVLNLELEEEEIITRLSGRYMCPECGRIYNIKNLKEKVCEDCKVELYQREDDKIESIKKRLEVAKEQTLPVVDYYKKQGLVTTIKFGNEETIEEGFVKVKKVLDDCN